MNKRERDAVCALLAAWEWEQGGSSSEASARSRCAAEIKAALNITEDDMQWARTWEIAGLCGIREDDQKMDALCDLIGAEGYEAVCDQIEEEGVLVFRGTLLPSPSPQVPS